MCRILKNQKNINSTIPSPGSLSKLLGVCVHSRITILWSPSVVSREQEVLPGGRWGWGSPGEEGVHVTWSPVSGLQPPQEAGKPPNHPDQSMKKAGHGAVVLRKTNKVERTWESFQQLPPHEQWDWNPWFPWEKLWVLVEREGAMGSPGLFARNCSSGDAQEAAPFSISLKPGSSYQDPTSRASEARPWFLMTELAPTDHRAPPILPSLFCLLMTPSGKGGLRQRWKALLFSERWCSELCLLPSSPLENFIPSVLFIVCWGKARSHLQHLPIHPTAKWMFSHDGPRDMPTHHFPNEPTVPSPPHVPSSSWGPVSLTACSSRLAHKPEAQSPHFPVFSFIQS